MRPKPGGSIQEWRPHLSTGSEYSIIQLRVPGGVVREGLTMGRSNMLKITLAAYALLSFQIPGAQGAGHAPEPGFCEGFYQNFDKTVGRTGRRDASVFPVTGLPFLRTTRFLEAIGYFVNDQAAWEQLVNLKFQEGMAAIYKEANNLSHADLEALMERWRREDRQPPTAMTLAEEAAGLANACAEEPMRRLKAIPRFQWLPRHHGTIPPLYHIERKVLGVYPLWALPIGAAITRYKRQVTRSYRTPLTELAPMGELRRFAPPRASALPPNRKKTGEILEGASNNPLGIPWMEKERLAELAALFAPVLEQDVTGDYDIPGTVVWDGDRIAVDVTAPAVYYYGTYALLRGRAVLQLNYVTWYTERPTRSAVDIGAGRIHGITIRTTLTPEGEPVMVDVIHNCGCYHFFYPAPAVFPSPRTGLFREDAFVPQWLPNLEPSSRLTLRIASKNHLVERIRGEDDGKNSKTPYRLIPYEQLESLPRKFGERESAFDPAGLVKGETERLERFLLFAVGIPEIGSMRQRGNHGTALVGERLFDDPRLFEKFFFLKE